MRRGRQDFFDAAFALLDTVGPQAVTAGGLCERLQVSRGSFYHHFASVDEFVEALLAEWEAQYTTQRLAALDRLSDDSVTGADQALLALTLHHEAEAALRTWGSQQPSVAAAVQRVDRLRLAGFRSLLVARGLPEEDAATWADLVVSSLVGLQVLERPFDLARLERVLRQVSVVLRERYSA